MIIFTLDKLLQGRTIYWLSKETGIKWDTVKAMAAGRTQRVDLELLERLCLALECQPGDLLKLELQPKRGGTRRQSKRKK